MQNNAEQLRKLMNIMESAASVSEDAMDPRLAKYISSYPDEVFSSKEDAMDKIRVDAEGGSRFAWAIGQLPDGRFVTGFPKHIVGFGLPVVAQGSSTDL